MSQPGSTSDYIPSCVGAPYTMSECISRLEPPKCPQLPAPVYRPEPGLAVSRLALAVPSMARHMTNEGWEIMLGLEHGGYTLCGYSLSGEDRLNHTDVPTVLRWGKPGIVVVQDKREWEGKTSGPGFDPRESFTGVGVLARWPNRFKLTILKDAHQNTEYHAQSAREMGCHAWVCYYHPNIVHHLAPFTRPTHLIRTYHTLDGDLFRPGSRLAGPNHCPDYDPYLVPPDWQPTPSQPLPIFLSENRRAGALVSGAVSSAYPLRKRVVNSLDQIPYLCHLKHPGYHRNGPSTPQYLQVLSGYKVAVCTASKYGYALRKIVEATAVGCVVVTDLPVDDFFPGIDGNLVRVRPDIEIKDLKNLLLSLYSEWDQERQLHYARLARELYDYRREGLRLAAEIEALRRGYST